MNLPQIFQWMIDYNIGATSLVGHLSAVAVSPRNESGKSARRTHGGRRPAFCGLVRTLFRLLYLIAGVTSILPKMESKCRTLVVGGGIFGTFLAAKLSARGEGVTLLEREADLLCRASFNNQARVHGGYHYPRSFKTGLSSRKGLVEFFEKFEFAVDRKVEKIYAIARYNSLVSPIQFESFCRQIQAPIRVAPDYQRLFNSDLIEATYRVDEYAFDAIALRRWAHSELSRHSVETLLEHTFCDAEKTPQGLLARWRDEKGQEIEREFREIYLVTYSGTNSILLKMGLAPLPVQNEWTEICLVDVPEELRAVGITVMDGPFFSIMPFPAKGLHSLSHVRFTPHRLAQVGEFGPLTQNGTRFNSHFELMVRDSARYLPLMREARLRESLFEIKSILPRRASNDSRPILLKKNYVWSGLNIVVGGKVDNIFDMWRELDCL